ncbi:MAG: amino acid permease [Planctomycetes bacterium]|nr:amino acid permease [Planctomycetota bacterium]
MESGQLQRRLGLTSAVSITVGAVIGSGIFLKPLKVAQALPSEWAIYAMWVGLGLVCLFGAFAYAELGAMLPEAGGQYAFLREGWGRFVGFLYGWTFFWVINAGTVAALALGFADNLLPLFLDPERVAAEKADPGLSLGIAVAMILVLALVNHFGVVLGALVQNLSTFAKVGALGLLVVGGLFAAGGGDAGTGAAASVEAAGGEWTMAGVVAAFMGIFWAYEGWYQMPFNAAELKRPERNLPLGLIGGMVILIVVYLFVNWTYLSAVPYEEMRAMGSDTADTYVATLTVERIFSPRLAGYLTLLIAISIFGAANPNMLSSPRAFYAMGQDGLVPHALTRVSARWGTPTVAIWVQAVVGVLLVVTLRGFHDVTAFVVFGAFLFYALTVAAVYVLRRRRPDAPRPYRCTGYPFTPAVFIAVALAFIAAVLRDPDERRNALIGLGIIATGVPWYLLWNALRRPSVG